jgi:hypothetical protein
VPYRAPSVNNIEVHSLVKGAEIFDYGIEAIKTSPLKSARCWKTICDQTVGLDGSCSGRTLSTESHVFICSWAISFREVARIYTVAALDRATDLDVLATRYIEPFQRQMFIAECKSGDNAPLDRVFWLSGGEAIHKRK